MSARPDVWHVAVSRNGRPIDTYQQRTQEFAEDLAASLRGKGFDVEITTGPVKTEKVPASNLVHTDVLADGTLIDRLYFGKKVNVTGFTPDYKRVVRRAYDPGKLVEIEVRS